MAIWSLEPRITFEASGVIDVASSTADWSVVMVGANFDAANDPQANEGLDLVGDADNPLFYTRFDDNNTATNLADDEIGFRFRIGTADNKGSFSGIGLVGIDGDGDGDLDLFLSADGRSSSAAVKIWAPGNDLNISPSTTSIAAPTNQIIDAFTSVNFAVTPVSATSDPTATSFDIDGDGNTDQFVSWTMSFQDVKNEMSRIAGITIDADSSLRYVIMTMTQLNSINGDIGGIAGGNSSTATFESLGTFSEPLTASNVSPSITSNGGGATAAVNVAENATAVTTVTASDPEGDTVTFSITGGDDSAKFSINSSTSVLTFAAAPDFENPTDTGANNTYVVTVQAADGNGGTDTQTITVTVTDVNDAPVITSDGGGATAAVNVAENSTAVTTVTAADADGDTPTFSITGGDDSGKFSIDSSTGVLTFVVAPDFENPTDTGANNTYVVTVQAADGNGGTDTQTITVTVTNLSEGGGNTSPSITSNGGGATASVNVAENTTAVTTVAATDPDAGDTVTFSITGGADQNAFSIDANSGALTFNSAPDFETPASAAGNNTYVVTVQAADGNGGTGTQTITVTVTDVNEAPSITSDGGGATAAVNVAENTTTVTTVAASDPDASDTVTFSITGGADQNAFSIDANSGALTFNSAPDFETPASAAGDNAYVVTVQASDGNGGIDAQTITVTVTDVNEVPTITSDGGGDTAAIDVTDDSSAVTTVTGIDDENDTMTFSIIGGEDAAAFSIDASTGALTFNSAPDFENPADADGDNTFVVTIQADDGNGGIDTQTITVSVIDVADDDPVDVTPVVFLDNDGPSLPVAPTVPDGDGPTAPGVGDVTLITTQPFQETAPAGLNGGEPGLASPLGDESTFGDIVADLATEPTSPAAPADVAAVGDPPAGEQAAEAASEASELASIEPAAGPTSPANIVAPSAQSADVSGGVQSAAIDSGDFTLAVDAGIADVEFDAQADTTFRFGVPDNAFKVVGEATAGNATPNLTLEVTQSDGTPLPEWLSFDPDTRTFTGEPPSGETITLDLKITARDDFGNEVSTTFRIVISSDQASGEPEQGDQAGPSGGRARR